MHVTCLIGGARESESYEALGCEVAEAKVTEDDFGGVEEVKGTAVVAAKEESLCLHVYIGGVVGEGSNFVGEENCGGVEVFADAVPHYSSKLLDLFFPHLIGFHSLGFSFSSCCCFCKFVGSFTQCFAVPKLNYGREGLFVVTGQLFRSLSNL